MRYYEVKAKSERYPLHMTEVSEQSLKGITAVFDRLGIELDATHTHSIPDKPIYRKAGEGEDNPGQLVINDIAASDY